MTSSPQARDPRSRLALGCSSLARAGQRLSVAGSPEEVRDALNAVAQQLEADQNLADLIPVSEIVTKCRETATSPNPTALITACRQMAATLARRASSLASEVQQKTLGVVPDSPAPAQPRAPVEAPPAATRPPTGQRPALQRASASPPSPAPEPESRFPQDEPLPNPVPASTPESPTPETRFVSVPGGILDRSLRLLWRSQPLPAASHQAALSSAAGLRDGQYANWRLPTVQELREFFESGGLPHVLSAANSPAPGPWLMWTTEVRSRFFGFLKRAMAVHALSREVVPRPLGDRSVLVLPVRDA